MEWAEGISEEPRRWLAAELEARRRKFPSYSLRAFAGKLGVSPSSLSQVLSGRRPLSVRMARQVATKLELGPRQRQSLLQAVVKDRVRRAQGKGDEPSRTPLTEVDVDTFRMVSEWYHFAILSLLETQGNRGTVAWIGKKLGLHPAVAEQALLRLRRLGMVEKKGRVHVRTNKSELETVTDIPSEEIRKWHRQILAKARESLEVDPVERRDFGGLTLAIDPDRLPEAKRILTRFRRDLGRLLEGGPKKQVYALTTQLFPLEGHLE